MKVGIIILLLLSVTLSAKFHWFNRRHHKEENRDWMLSMFYCGFGGEFCGQSTEDDVNPQTDNVILAFVNTHPNGSVYEDQENFPTALVSKWQGEGKKVLISVGGQNGNWAYIFASADATTNFCNSVKDILDRNNLDGVDIDIESYMVSPRTVANMFLQLRETIGTGKLIIASPECVAVYQGVADYSADTAGQAYNYFVNVIRLADSAIDYYQPQAYNNWYDVGGGSLDYIKDVYLNWRNLKGIMSWMVPLEDFTGVAGDKLLMGVLASTSAGGAAYYYPPEVITAFKAWLEENNYPLKGFMMWDSHWDTLNNNVISNTCVA